MSQVEKMKDCLFKRTKNQTFKQVFIFKQLKNNKV